MNPAYHLLVQRLDRVSAKAALDAKRIEWVAGILLIVAMVVVPVVTRGTFDTGVLGQYVFVLLVGFQAASLGSRLGRLRARADLASVLRSLLEHPNATDVPRNLDVPKD